MTTDLDLLTTAEVMEPWWKRHPILTFSACFIMGTLFGGVGALLMVAATVIFGAARNILVPDSSARDAVGEA